MSHDLDAVLRRSHTVVVWGEILNGGLPDPRFGRPPLTNDGSTVMTRAQLVRRRSSITVADPSWVPARPTDALAALGLEMRLWYEVRTPNQRPVATPLITGHILTEQHDTPFTGIPVTVVDRLWRVSVDEAAGKITVRGSVLASIRSIILQSVPWATFRVHPDIEANDFEMAPTVFDSKAAALAKLPASIGADSVHANGYGTVQLVPVPDVANVSAWQVDAGPNGVLVKATESRSTENAPNSVIVTGAATSGKTPESDLIVDDDPHSISYYGPVDGPPVKSHATGTYYPRQIKKWSGPMTSKSQCNIAARATLLQFKGQAKSIQFGSVANPALDDGDTILVRPRLSDPGERHLLDSWSLRHDGSGMDGQSRTVTLADAGADDL